MVALLLSVGTRLWLMAPVVVVLLLGVILAHQWDLLKKTAVIMYDVDPEAGAAFQQLHEALSLLAKRGGVWNICAQGDVHDRKHFAGAAQVVDRSRIFVGERMPPLVRTNISVCRIAVRTGSLYFFPDGVLVYGPAGVGAVSYGELELGHALSRFVEEGRVPHDAKIVDRTWKYVNKGGGPDRRFKANRELPICEYEEIRLWSSSGLHELLQVSRAGIGERLASAVQNMALALANATESAAAVPKKHIEQPSGPVPSAAKRVSGSDHRANFDIYEAVFLVLCCVMVSDGRASSTEKSRIIELVHKAGSKWEPDLVAARLTKFVHDVQSKGFKPILETTLALVPMFKAGGREKILLNCISSLVDADGVLTDKEQTIVTRIRDALR